MGKAHNDEHESPSQIIIICCCMWLVQTMGQSQVVVILFSSQLTTAAEYLSCAYRLIILLWQLVISAVPYLLIFQLLYIQSPHFKFAGWQN